MHHCLASKHYVNVITAGKHQAPQWLTMEKGRQHCTQGIGIWEWASNDQGAEPDIVMACAGDVPTREALAAVTILRKLTPKLKIRLVNVVALMKLTSTKEHPHGLDDGAFDSLFTKKTKRSRSCSHSMRTATSLKALLQTYQSQLSGKGIPRGGYNQYSL
jgi:xylulose-5-phosphate/fructose-6-phosphate phosphoketolase